MMKINKEKDNIISIVKSLHPIDYLYSKQNRDYDKYFRGSSLKGLIKQINSRPIFNEYMKPGESFEEMKIKKNTFMDVNFKSTFNYIQELDFLKKLPFASLDKNNNKRGRYYNAYKQHKLNKKEKHSFGGCRRNSVFDCGNNPRVKIRQRPQTGLGT